MRVLLDESVPRALGFELGVTFDQNLPYQQNEQLPVAVVVLVAPNNRLETAKKFVPQILNSLTTLDIGQLVRLSLL